MILGRIELLFDSNGNDEGLGVDSVTRIEFLLNFVCTLVLHQAFLQNNLEKKMYISFVVHEIALLLLVIGDEDLWHQNLGRASLLLGMLNLLLSTTHHLLLSLDI